MIWLLVVIAVVLVVIALAVGYHGAPSDAAAYRAAIDLRAIRRRREVAQFKGEVRWDGARARRELRYELGELNRQERKL
jgi:hypothetical protein